MEEEMKSCDNCSYSRLNPCPYLNKTCGPDLGYAKWVEKKEGPITFKSEFVPSSEDAIEEQTRKTMMERKKTERPMLKFKLIMFFSSVLLVFVALFVFKAMQFISHILFIVVVLVMLAVFILHWVKRVKQ